MREIQLKASLHNAPMTEAKSSVNSLKCVNNENFLNSFLTSPSCTLSPHNLFPLFFFF